MQEAYIKFLGEVTTLCGVLHDAAQQSHLPTPLTTPTPSTAWQLFLIPLPFWGSAVWMLRQPKSMYARVSQGESWGER